MQHCSFTTSEAQFEALKKRLADHGVPIIGPINVGAGSWSMYFFDPNGHRLELAADIGTPEMLQKLDDVKWPMLEEWSRTRKAPAHARWMHDGSANA